LVNYLAQRLDGSKPKMRLADLDRGSALNVAGAMSAAAGDKHDATG